MELASKKVVASLRYRAFMWRLQQQPQGVSTTQRRRLIS